MDIFDKIFQNNSDAIIFKNQTINYSELHKKVLSTVNFLTDKNIKETDNVVMLGENSSDFIILILALWKIGAIPVLLNFSLTENELNKFIDIISPSKILVERELNYTPRLENHKYLNYPFEYQESDCNEKFSFNFNNIALIIFTSGSSGKSKGVKLSFNNLFKSAKSQNNFLELNQNNKYLASLPFYHIGGFSIITRTLLSGGTIVIPNSIKNEDIIDVINKFQPKSISLVPTQLKKMLEKNFSPPEYLKNVLLGGSFIENDLIGEAIKKGWKLIKVFGSTETCSFITAKRINSVNDISNSLGKVIGDNEIKIVDGQIAIKGESIMQGYFNLQTDFTEDGFFVTEDIGHIGENNELIIDGRRDDIIISGGENISLIEIENHVNKFEKIKDAVVIGLKDDEWGEILTIVAVTFNNDIFPLIDLNNYLSENIARFKLPKKIYFVDEIPRNEMGKVMRNELMKKISSKEF